jgi:hypothetical protein
MPRDMMIYKNVASRYLAEIDEGNQLPTPRSTRFAATGRPVESDCCIEMIQVHPFSDQLQVVHKAHKLTVWTTDVRQVLIVQMVA